MDEEVGEVTKQSLGLQLMGEISFAVEKQVVLLVIGNHVREDTLVAQEVTDGQQCADDVGDKSVHGSMKMKDYLPRGK